VDWAVLLAVSVLLAQLLPQQRQHRQLPSPLFPLSPIHTTTLHLDHRSYLRPFTSRVLRSGSFCCSDHQSLLCLSTFLLHPPRVLGPFLPAPATFWHAPTDNRSIVRIRSSVSCEFTPLARVGGGLSEAQDCAARGTCLQHELARLVGTLDIWKRPTNVASEVTRTHSASMARSMFLGVIALLAPTALAQSCISLAESTTCPAFNASSISTDSALVGL